MLNLILKDFLVQKREKTLLVILALGIGNAFNIGNGIGLNIGIIIMSTYLFTVYANAFDYKYNAEVTILSLPIRRSQVVQSKYISVFFFYVISILFTLVPMVILETLGVVNGGGALGLKLALISFPILCLYYSFFFPIYFKLGYMKSRYANWLALVLMTAILGAFGQGLSGDMTGNAVNTFEDLMTFLMEKINSETLGLLLTISLGLFLISMHISKAIYANKEF